MEEKKVQLTYKQGSLGRIFSTHMFDFFCVFVLSIIVLIGSLFILQSTPVYNDINIKRETIRLNSRLYSSTDEGCKSIYVILKNDDTKSYNEKSDELASSLNYFFDDYLVNNSNIDSPSQLYTDKLLECTYDDKVIFNENRERLYIESTMDEVYYTYYLDICQNYAVGLLSNVNGYLSIQRAYLFSYVITILLTISFSILIIYLVIPLCLHRGKRTLGMLLNHLSYVTGNGLSPTYKKTIVQFLLKWILIYMASVFTFAIPLFISVGMIFLNKHHQCFTDYVVNVYFINDDDVIIYEKIEDIKRNERLLQKADEELKMK